jgi:hypothetical protein
MKLDGNALSIRETIKVVLPRFENPIELTISSIPMGLRREYETIFPKPRPPFTVQNFVGKPAEKIEDWDNPEFVIAHAEHAFLFNVFIVYTVIKADTRITFDFVPNNIDGLRRLSEEFKQAGFSEGDIGIIIKAAAEASNITDRDIREVKKSF